MFYVFTVYADVDPIDKCKLRHLPEQDINCRCIDINVCQLQSVFMSKCCYKFPLNSGNNVISI